MADTPDSAQVERTIQKYDVRTNRSNVSLSAPWDSHSAVANVFLTRSFDTTRPDDLGTTTTTIMSQADLHQLSGGASGRTDSKTQTHTDAPIPILEDAVGEWGLNGARFFFSSVLLGNVNLVTNLL